MLFAVLAACESARDSTREVAALSDACPLSKSDSALDCAVLSDAVSLPAADSKSDCDVDLRSLNESESDVTSLLCS